MPALGYTISAISSQTSAKKITHFKVKKAAVRKSVKKNLQVAHSHNNHSLIKFKSSKKSKLYNKSIIQKNNITNNDFKVDFVFPYVNNNDSEWLEEFNKYYSKNFKKVNAGVLRYRDYGTLKFLFRSIEQNMPWINNIYMIVMSESQIPDWVNTNKVNIIYHKDFIPNQYLPVFNSSAIEMFLHNLPGVSDYFIYGNDDIFPVRQLKKTDFFINNFMKKSLHERQYRYYWDQLRRQDLDLIYGKNYHRGRILSDLHGLTPYNKTAINKCFNQHKNNILKSITKFREKKNYNRWIFDIYDHKHQLTIGRSVNTLKTDITSSSIYKCIKNKKYKILCCNDSECATDKQINRFYDYLLTLFPNKSKYEI